MEDLTKFVNAAIKQDNRNVFSEYKGKIENIPNFFIEFYRHYNPIDVEVTINGACVKFFPYETIDRIQKEYSLGDNCFVFASCNGDPIYLRNGKIYSCVFGKEKTIEDLIANSIGEYLDTVK